VSYFTLRWSSKKMQTDGLSRPASGALRTALVQATGSVKKGPAFVVEEFDHDSPPSVRAGSPRGTHNGELAYWFHWSAIKTARLGSRVVKRDHAARELSPHSACEGTKCGLSDYRTIVGPHSIAAKFLAPFRKLTSRPPKATGEPRCAAALRRRW